MIRIALLVILFFSVLASTSVRAEKTAEQLAKEEQKIAAKEAKKLEKQKRKEEKIRLKAEKKQQAEEEKQKRLEEIKKKQEEDALLMTYTNEDLTKLDSIINKFANYLGKDSHDYKYQVVKSKYINAYASLGKKITVNSALFHKVKTEAGLATVIAHELGHVERKHVMKGVATGVASTAAGTALSLLTGTRAAGDLFSAVSSPAKNAYSRSHERNADLFSIDLMNKLYCDSPGKLEMFELILEEQKAAKAFPYAQTHPLTTDRIEYMTVLIKDAGCVI